MKILFEPYIWPQMINHSIWIDDINQFIQRFGATNYVTTLTEILVELDN